MNTELQHFGAALTALFDELDWARLGRSYCEGDGSTFFDEELRSRVLEVGLQLADDVAGGLPKDGVRRSLYVGAAVAELAPILAESVVLGREVCWVNLAGDEVEELVRALQIVSTKLGFVLPQPSTEPLANLPVAQFDHVWMVSVLTDPDAFPALHDQLYRRSGGPRATGRGDLDAERARAQLLVEQLLARAAPVASLTTTDEELGFAKLIAERAGFVVGAPSAGRLSAIVSDRVRVVRLERR